MMLNNVKKRSVLNNLYPHKLLFFCCLIGSMMNAQTIDSSFVDGRVMLRVDSLSDLNLSDYDSSNTAFNLIISNFNIDSIAQPFPNLNSDLDRTFRVFFSDIANIDDLVTALIALGEFEYVEKEPIYYLNYSPNDTDFGLLWYKTKIQLEDAWDVTKGDGSVLIAIVDNAVSTTHQDLSNNIWNNPGESTNLFDDDLNGYTNDYNGWDVADNDNDPNPPSSADHNSPFTHGTHCAGTAAAESDNANGIAGVGFNLTILPVKCSPDNSNGEYLTNAYDGVYYAVRAGADIVSMSWGGSGGVFITGQSIIDAANTAGLVLVAAAGNSNTSDIFYPAGYNNVIGVGASNSNDQRASFSNYGNYIDVMAPGVGLYSPVSGGSSGNAYGYKSGTSMACPLAAGICGLILTQNPNLTTTQVETLLESSCDNIDSENPDFIGNIGAGRVNAFRAVQNVGSTLIEGDLPTEQLFYPNPSSQTLMFNQTVIAITLFDASGKIILSKTVENEIDISSLSKGTYILRLKTGFNTFQNEKLIINE